MLEVRRAVKHYITNSCVKKRTDKRVLGQCKRMQIGNKWLDDNMPEDLADTFKGT